MIGVDLREGEIDACREFFELFKTPWEIYHRDRPYDVVLSTSDVACAFDAGLCFIYNSDEVPFDVQNNIRLLPADSDKILLLQEAAIPLYGKCSKLVHGNGESRAISLEVRENGRTTVRFGFDIFSEIQFLLTQGQPRENALIPTLDLHIAVLRHYIVNEGIPLVEIPPSPAGYPCMACLTHDVDFIGIRQHFFDHSMFGFLYRSLIGSTVKFCKKKISVSAMLQNWKAAFSLPFVYAGIIKDIWDDFDEYLSIEKGINSTYFFMPFKNRPGKKVTRPHGYKRAAKYTLEQAARIISKLLKNSCEIGVHGIDAWHDVALAKEERERISAHTKASSIGTRIHWLCFNEDSFKILDKADYSYDSTFGYNDEIGFRAGTSQVFRPLGCANLLELPLHIQDTALFRNRMMPGSKSEILKLCKAVADHCKSAGGAVTVLWHTRSLVPDRLYKDFYIVLLDLLKTNNVRFGSAMQITEWFRNRRAVQFEAIFYSNAKATIRLSNFHPDMKPSMHLRLSKKDARTCSIITIDKPLQNSIELSLDSLSESSTSQEGK